MSENTRKHRFHWDMKDDIQPPSELGEQIAWTRRERHSGFHDGLPPKFTDLDMNNVLKNSRDYSGLSSWEQLQGNSTAKRDDNISRDRQKKSETMRAWDGHKSYHKSMSPADDRGQRTKSPSPCRGRDRSRCRARGRSRSVGRGRSRSRSRGKLRHWSGSLSRSPVHDHRRESYGLNDKRSGSGMPSQPCKDFAVGKCRRGSQCRFLHQVNREYRDRGHPKGSNSVERWRIRSEHGDALKDSNIRGLRDFPRDNVSDGYADGYGCGEPPPVKNNSKAKISCRDFLKGKCQWGASCRFSHDDASNDNYLTGNRNSSFGHDREHQSNRSGRPPCKFFAMGKCQRDDCRFSHDDQKSRNLELGSSDDMWVHDADYKNISWTGPTWEEATCVSGITKSTGWDNSLAPEECLPDPLTGEKGTDGECGYVSQKEKSTWNGKKWFDGALKGDERQECGNNGSGMETTEYMEKLVYKEELQFNSEGPQSQIWDTNIHGINGNHQLSNTVTQPKVSETSFYQQLQGRNISGSAFHNALPDVKCSANTSHSISLPEQGLHKMFDSMGSQPLMNSTSSSRSQDILSVYPSSRQSSDLNGALQHIFTPLGLQEMEINHEETFKTQVGLELEVPPVSSEVSQKFLTSEKFAQITSLPASEGFDNGRQLPPLDARFDGKNSELMMRCTSSTSLIPTRDSMILECNPTLPSKPSNSNHDPRFLPSPYEQNDHMPLEQLVLPSLVNHGPGMIKKRDGLKEEYYTSPKLKQQEPVKDAEVYGKEEPMIAEKCKQKEENLHSETTEAEHRIDEGMNSKDDKGMRLFKIALVEFVKEILKPTWKEGKMSREVHKTIVKKVVDKVTNTIQGDHVPKSQDKVDQYLSFSKPKITKLVQAYIERFLKN